MKQLRPLLLFCFLAFPFYNTQAAIPLNQNTSVRNSSNHTATTFLDNKKPDIIQKIVSVLKRTAQPDEKPKEMIGTDGYAVAAFLISILGIFIAGILFGAIGFAFGLTALRRIGDGSKRGGRGLAIAGMVVGVIAFFGALIVIGSM